MLRTCFGHHGARGEAAEIGVHGALIGRRLRHQLAQLLRRRVLRQTSTNLGRQGGSLFVPREEDEVRKERETKQRARKERKEREVR